MEKRAVGKYVRGSAQKARLVIDQIRGLPVEDALNRLRFSPKRSAKHIEKVLKSAIANVEYADESISLDHLVVSQAFVDMGPTKWRRRVRPAPMGRAYRERRHGCHVTIYVSDSRR
ncbi:MAG TPA: 50S ribosomal protein L22 [Acidobacteriota bacterium]|nr:50S ribosomal protein L22 [Acidobacteriota bacterium]HQM62616.1 50S ribosomal protein L22 [Acidobacteriota bacterium]